jgi:hypothetical protein
VLILLSARSIRVESSVNEIESYSNTVDFDNDALLPIGKREEMPLELTFYTG